MKKSTESKTKQGISLKYHQLNKRLHKAVQRSLLPLLTTRNKRELLTFCLRYEKRLHQLGISLSIGLPLLSMHNEIEAQTLVGNEFRVND
ncbi:MAG: hypothetical protein AAGI49_15130 [Bacteroidota bacterium]